MVSLFDTHCHLYDRSFEHDLSEVIKRALENSVGAVLVPAENLNTCTKTINLCAAYKNIPLFAAGGIHPHEAEQGKKEFLEFKKYFKDHDFSAVGEIGLDYYRMLSDKAIQLEVFRECLEFAAEVDKPVILHNRDADDDMLSILSDWISQLPDGSPLKEIPGVFHSYNGDPQVLDFALKHHFYLGIGGMITFKKSDALRAILQNVPLEYLLLETDAPYMTPHPYRGKRNEPAYVRFTAQELANVLEIPLEQVVEQTTLNANHLVGLSS